MLSIQGSDSFESIKPTFAGEQQTDTRAVVIATIENFGETTVVTLDLTRTAGAWRLADIIASEGSSLLAELKELNAAKPSE